MTKITELKVKEKLEGYSELLSDIRSLLQKARYRAYKAIDNLRVQTYWQIGERIVREELRYRERADYGQKLIEELAVDLNLERSLLFRIVQFYKTYPIVVTLSRQLSWSHYQALMAIENDEQRRFYEQQTMRNAWSIRELRRQIHSNLYENVQKEGKIVQTMSAQFKPPDVDKIFKDSYNFNFLGLPEDHTEEELKAALLNKLEKFLQELGSDFFIGRRELPIVIGGQYFNIDLELFHAALNCYVLVEVKTEKFKPAHVGQMNAYLNWYKDNRWLEGQRHPIGLIICKTKDEETVHYALGDLKKDIFVSEYKTKLPSEEDIKREIIQL